jgi:hypothetical protein
MSYPLKPNSKTFAMIAQFYVFFKPKNFTFVDLKLIFFLKSNLVTIKLPEILLTVESDAGCPKTSGIVGNCLTNSGTTGTWYQPLMATLILS